MFSIGDEIVYGGMGVCTVMDICVPDLPGKPRQCYILKPHYVAGAKVYAPVEENPVKMRPLLSAEQAQTLIDGMPFLAEFPQDREKQELYNTYRTAIKSADCTQLAKLVKTLYEKKQRVLAAKKIVPSAEKEYFDTAEKMLYGEIAVALHMPIEQVQEYIASRVSGNAPQQSAVS